MLTWWLCLMTTETALQCECKTALWPQCKGRLRVALQSERGMMTGDQALEGLWWGVWMYFNIHQAHSKCILDAHWVAHVPRLLQREQMCDMVWGGMRWESLSVTSSKRQAMIRITVRNSDGSATTCPSHRCSTSGWLLCWFCWTRLSICWADIGHKQLGTCCASHMWLSGKHQKKLYYFLSRLSHLENPEVQISIFQVQIQVQISLLYGASGSGYVSE